MPFRIMKFKRGQVVESACTYQSTAVLKEGCDSYRTVTYTRVLPGRRYVVTATTKKIEIQPLAGADGPIWCTLVMDPVTGQEMYVSQGTELQIVLPEAK